jgi:hypothetical protein
MSTVAHESLFRWGKPNGDKTQHLQSGTVSKLPAMLHVGPLDGIVAVQGIDGKDLADVWVKISGGKIGVFDDDKKELKTSMQAESAVGLYELTPASSSGW